MNIVTDKPVSITIDIKPLAWPLWTIAVEILFIYWKLFQ